MRIWALVAALSAGWFGIQDARAELRLAAGQWRYDIAGRVEDRGRVYDFEEDLALRPRGKRSVVLEFDTGPGFWPDFTASHSELGARGHREETFTVFQLPPAPPLSETRSIVASADFDDYDIAAQYPFGLGRARASAGVVAKRLRGTLRIQDSEEPEPIVEEYDETIPQLRLQLRWPAAQWLTLVGAYQGIRYGGSSASEWRATAEVRWRALLLEGGWQAKAYDIDVDDYALDAELDGWLLRGGFVWR